MITDELADLQLPPPESPGSIDMRGVKAWDARNLLSIPGFESSPEEVAIWWDSMSPQLRSLFPPLLKGLPTVAIARAVGRPVPTTVDGLRLLYAASGLPNRYAVAAFCVEHLPQLVDVARDKVVLPSRPLSPLMRTVMDLRCLGMTSEQIRKMLDTSENSVENVLRDASERLGTSNGIQAVVHYALLRQAERRFPGIHLAGGLNCSLRDARLWERSLPPELRQLLPLLMEGLWNAEMADRLSLSVDTVKDGLSALYATSGMHTRHGLAAFCLRHLGGRGHMAGRVKMPRTNNRPPSPPLFERMCAVMDLYSLGMTKPAIAEALGVSVDTVKTQLADAYQRLGADNAVRAVIRYTRLVASKKVAPAVRLLPDGRAVRLVQYAPEPRAAEVSPGAAGRPSPVFHMAGGLNCSLRDARLWERSLTPELRELLPLLMEGLKNAEMADRLGIPIDTVKDRLSVLYETSGMPTRHGLAVFCLKHLAATPHNAGIVKMPGISIRLPSPPLTEGMRVVMDLRSQGLTAAAIATALGVSVDTVKTQLGDAYRRLGTDNAVRAVIRYTRLVAAKRVAPAVRLSPEGCAVQLVPRVPQPAALGPVLISSPAGRALPAAPRRTRWSR